MSQEQHPLTEWRKPPGEPPIGLIDADGKRIKPAEVIRLAKMEGVWNAYAIVRLNSGEWALFAREPEEFLYAPYAELSAKTEAEARDEAVRKMGS